MGNSINNIEIGPIIKQKLIKSRYTPTQFKNEIGLSRQTVYNLFKKKSIDIDLLCEISILLGYDFLELYNEYVRNNINGGRVK